MRNNQLKLIKLRMTNSSVETDQNTYFMSLKELITETTFSPSFFITSYQRTYSWEKKQIEELMSDIYSLDSNSTHFTGIFYFGKSEPNFGSPVIDGQQRLTTIFLISKFLFEDPVFGEEMNSPIANQEHKNKYLSFQNNFNRCQLKLEIDNVYYNLLDFKNLQEDDNLVKEYKNRITDGMRIIKNFFADHEVNLYKFMEGLFEKLIFLTIQCDDEKSELALFRIINSKGKHLDDIDKAKCLIISDFYKNDNETKKFISLWSTINKQKNKKSFKTFFNDLTVKLGGNRKFKYNDFDRLVKNHNADFPSVFEKSVDNFRWFSLPENCVFTEASNNESVYWKNFQAMSYLNKRVFKEKFEAEVMKEFNKYESGERSSVLLFSLFLFSYVVEAKYNFSGTDGKLIIDAFIKMNERERKSELKKLFCEFDSKNMLDDIQYKQKGVTDNVQKIKSKHNCVLPFYVLINSSATQGYFNVVKKIVISSSKCLDHEVPKKKTPNKKSVRKWKNKSFSESFNPRSFTQEELKTLNSFYNLSPIDARDNSNKSAYIPNDYIMKDGECITGFDYEKIFEDLERKRQSCLENLRDFILNLTE